MSNFSLICNAQIPDNLRTKVAYCIFNPGGKEYAYWCVHFNPKPGQLALVTVGADMMSLKIVQVVRVEEDDHNPLVSKPLLGLVVDQAMAEAFHRTHQKGPL